jgi:Ni/Co efflux regulator RcnB
MRKALLAAVAIVTMGALPVTEAFAAPPSSYSQYGDRRDDQRSGNDQTQGQYGDQRNDQRGRNDQTQGQWGDQRDGYRQDDRQYQRGSYEVYGQRYERMAGPSWRAPRHYRHQNWQRGQRLPRDYRQVVVRDYRSYHLAPPPRGYEYVRVNDDVVLTGIATGVIAAIIANAFYN